MAPEAFELDFPLVKLYENGDVIFTKVESSGGMVTEDTCKEQALYEVNNPANYYHADTIVDLSHVVFEQIAKNRVQMTGIKGKPAPKQLKVALDITEGYFSSATIWLADPGARARAEWTREAVCQI